MSEEKGLSRKCKVKHFVMLLAHYNTKPIDAYYEVFMKDRYPGRQRTSRIDATCRERSKRLLSREDVQILYDRECSRSRVESFFTPDQHLNVLEHLRELAVDSGDISAAIRAESKRGEALGMYVKKTEVVKDDIDAAKAKQELISLIMDNKREFLQLIKDDPEMAKELGFDGSGVATPIDLDPSRK